jgi:hypothetical protein
VVGQVARAVQRLDVTTSDVARAGAGASGRRASNRVGVAGGAAGRREADALIGDLAAVDLGLQVCEALGAESDDVRVVVVYVVEPVGVLAHGPVVTVDQLPLDELGALAVVVEGERALCAYESV